MAKNKVQIVITAKDLASKTFGKLKNTLFSLKGAIAGLGLVLLTKKLITASNEQAKAVAALETAIDSMNRSTPNLSQNLQNVASALQEVTNYGDEVTLSGTKLLMTYKEISDDVMPETMSTMLDLAALMGGDVTSAANMLGKASMGMTGELRRAGITVDINTYKNKGYLGVLKEIQDQVGGQAVAQREATGSSIALGNSIGDLTEKLGDITKIALEPAFKALLSFFDDLNIKLKDTTTAKKWAKEIGEIFLTALEIITTSVSGISKSVSGFRKVFASVAGGINKVRLRDAITDLEYYEKIASETTGEYKKQWEERAAAQRKLRDELKLSITASEMMFDSATGDAKKYAEIIEKVRGKLAALKNEPPPDFTVKRKDASAKSGGTSEETLSADQLAQSSLARLSATMKTALTILANTYEQGKITLEEYFKQRLTYVEEQYQAEMAVLEASAEKETDISKKQGILDKIFAKEEEHKRTLIELTNQQKAAEDALFQKKLELDEMFSDLRARASSEKESQYTTELAEMDARHAEELQRFKDLLDDKLAAEMGYATKKAGIEDVVRQQQAEKDSLKADQEKKIRDERIEGARILAGGLKDIFQNLYEASDKQQKEFFYLSKAAAIAQAMINTYQGATKAYGNGGWTGAAQAALVVAAGGALVAKMAAQSLAEGGMVGGYSPHSTADNVPINATAGEFMQPVSSVRYYGKGVMEAIRKKMIPRDMFLGLQLPRSSYASSSFNFAEGGPVSARGQQKQETTIVNFIDPQAFDQYMASTAGQKTLVNAIGANSQGVKKVLFER